MSSSRRAFLARASSLALLCVLPACARGTEDPIKTQLFTSFLNGVLAGKPPVADLDSDMKIALTPDRVAEIRARYAPLGRLQSLRFLGQDEAQGYQRFHYLGTFAGGTQGLLFVLDAGGKIAGFFNE